MHIQKALWILFYFLYKICAFIHHLIIIYIKDTPINRHGSNLSLWSRVLTSISHSSQLEGDRGRRTYEPSLQWPQPEVLNIALFSHVPDLVTRPVFPYWQMLKLSPFVFAFYKQCYINIRIHRSYVCSLLFL